MSVFFNESESRLFKQVNEDLTSPWLGHFLDDNDLILNYYTNSLTVLSFQWELFTTIVNELFKLIKSLGQSVFYLLTLNTPELQESLFHVFKAPIVALSRMALITGVGFLHLTRISSLALSNLASFLFFTVALPITIIPIIVMLNKDSKPQPDKEHQNMQESARYLRKYNRLMSNVLQEEEQVLEAMRFYKKQLVLERQYYNSKATLFSPQTTIYNTQSQIVSKDIANYTRLLELMRSYPEIDLEQTDNSDYIIRTIAELKNHHQEVLSISNNLFGGLEKRATCLTVTST